MRAPAGRRLSHGSLDGLERVVGVAEGPADKVTPRFTHAQGQYLAFIAAYTKVNGVAPAEADMQRYFRTTPPSVHGMVLTLAKRGLIVRTPGRARSIQVLVRREELPELD